MKHGVKIIGLCGRSGSGKGYVCESFAARGIPSVDTDAVYHKLTEPGKNGKSECLNELAFEFGAGIVNSNGNLDRPILSEIVFSDAEKLKRLNEITHKFILKETENIIDEYIKAGVPAVIVDAPVLFESGFDSLCDITLFVSCSEEKSVQRIIRRDGITEEAAKKRLARQKSCEELRRLCDYEIVNDGILDIDTQVDAFLSAYEIRT